MTATSPFSRQAVRRKLAELLREPLERVANETRLYKLGRWNPEVARELLKTFGLEVPEERLRALERVRDLLEVVEGAPAAGGGPAAAPPAFEVLPQPQTAPPPASTVPAPEGSYVSTLPYEDARIRAAAVYCSDGRVGEQMDEFLHHHLSLPRYDRVACPGGPVALSGRLMAMWECRGVDDQVRFLLRVHRLGAVVLIAHEGCAYYLERLGIRPAELEAEQRRDLEMAASALRRMGQPLEVSAYLARRAGGRIRFEPVTLAR